MKIAFILLHPGKVDYFGGVGKKISSQIKIWREFGQEVNFFVFTSENIPQEDNVIFRHASKNRSFTGLVLREIDRTQTLTELIRRVSEYKPDLIYIRYGRFTFPLQQLFNIAPTVFELNTLDVYEFGMSSPYKGAINFLFRGSMLRAASGIVATSNEINQHPSFANFNLPSVVISNGIDYSAEKIVKTQMNSRPRLVFIGTPFQPWAGVDKLIRFAQKTPGIEFDVIGTAEKDVLSENISSNMQLHGFLSYEEYLPILERADVAIGPMALHRKRMNEASPLKVREYLAHGIPTILPYFDSDIGNEQLGFILEIPNNEDNLDMHREEIKTFVNRIKGERFSPNQIFPLIDSRPKEKRRLDFFEEIVQ